MLRHSADSEAGISRRKRGKGFSYHSSSGETVKDEKTLERIKLLGLPPAYKNVWICADEYGHIQATGRDDRGRKQYRYHTAWSDFRAQKKFDRLADFAEALPALRRRLVRDLKQTEPSKSFVCAALTRLIDRTSMRIGNAHYAEENGSFGATTLKRKHVKFLNDRLSFDYRAKGGKRVRCTTSDKTLNKTLNMIDELPGQRLFQYIGETGDIYPLDSSDVNAYIGENFSAKTFRTWRGTVAAFEVGLSPEPMTIKALSEAAAETLYNTPAICRNSYIHPAVIGLADKTVVEKETLIKSLDTESVRGLRKSEAQCLAFLKTH